jgi:hypothetical protein
VIELAVKGLNCKTLEEAGRRNMVASGVSDGNVEHASNASMMEMAKTIMKISPRAPFLQP